MQNVSGEHQPEMHPQPGGQPYQKYAIQKPKRSIWGCLLSAAVTLLLTAGLIVLGVLLYQSQSNLNSTQNKLHRTRDDLAEASATRKAQDKAIAGYEVDLGNARATSQAQYQTVADAQDTIAGLSSQVDDLNSQLSKAKSDLSSARSQIDDLQDQLPVKITVINNFGQPQLLGFDNTVWFYVRAGSTVSFYIKPGTYHVVACHPDNIQTRSHCSDWGTYTVDKDWEFTIKK